MNQDMHRQLSRADLQKIGAIMSLLFLLGISGIFVWQKAQASREEAAFVRQTSLEMGRKEEALLTSKPEENEQRNDPHFQP